jgi:hypothetical protein
MPEIGSAEAATILTSRHTGSKELLRLELELAVTFANVARTKYSMGNVAGGSVSRSNAEKAYRGALKIFVTKFADITSSERRTLKGLIKNAKDAIATLPKAGTRK